MIETSEFDARFDAGEDIVEHLDLNQARRPGHETKRVNVDFPEWIVAALDREARRLGISRQALIKVWLAERLEQGAHHERPSAA